ncbi:CCA tRNA nucleotidyltransferase [Bacillus sp. JJ1764]|uniref:CCA tRNA nucleotidyltransferase n=1 Tax=Bacillus sp. JJ1764 TaxID=3122964 RepID=UPI002FFF5767
MKEPFLSAVPVLEKLVEAGFEAYFVGGSVRDYLLNKQISDVDIATSATPEEVKRIFRKTVDVGIEHGTVLVLHNQRSYEITTFRTEGEYVDFRRPKEVAFIRNLQEDLQRRDFTMNAMAMDRFGTIFDPYKGQDAIKAQLIKTVGPSQDRFHEDALRMMRAVRFASQLSFRIDEETLEALSKFNYLLDKIAVERKRTEFEKLLIGQNRRQALKILLDSSLYKYLPGLQNQKHLIGSMISYKSETLNLSEMWVLLLHCLKVPENQIDTFLREWRLSIKEVKEISHIFRFFTLRLQKKWTVYDLYLAGGNTIMSVERLYSVILGSENHNSIDFWLKRYQELPIKERSELKVTGNDLLTWFNRKGGPWVKETLEKVETGILEGNVLNDYQRIKEWLMTCSQK